MPQYIIDYKYLMFGFVFEFVSLCGYNSPASMIGFNDKTLAEVTEFIRNELDHCFASPDGESCRLTNADRVHFCGASYAARPAEFKFTIGHISLIR